MESNFMTNRDLSADVFSEFNRGRGRLPGEALPPSLWENRQRLEQKLLSESSEPLKRPQKTKKIVMPSDKHAFIGRVGSKRHMNREDTQIFGSSLLEIDAIIAEKAVEEARQGQDLTEKEQIC